MTCNNIRAPNYYLKDTEEGIEITVLAPLSKPNEANFLVDKKVFTFISNPYFLKISLPHSVCNVVSESTFDPNTTTYVVKLKKLSEVLSESSDDDFAQNKSDNDASSFIPSQKSNEQCYGFANRYSKMFGKLADAFSEVINLPNPDNTPVELRRELRLQEENEKWNEDHYLADTMETDHLESIFKYQPSWIKSSVTELNDDMKELLNSCKSLKNVELSPECLKLTEFHIVDILFCYAYDKRINEGDVSVESGWTINKLSGTLSWFEVFEDLKAVLLSCYRRSLIYPLYRNWHLTQLVHQDVANLLQNGSIQVIHSLLEIKEIFNESENRYLLNTLYINDLCSYIYHHITKERFLELSEEVKQIEIKKYEVVNDLPLLEVAAHLTLEEELEKGKEPKNIAQIIKGIGKLTLKKTQNTESSDDSSRESDTEESSPDQSSDEYD